MEVLLLLFLILLNGGFAMSEIALVSARRSRLANLARAGRRGAARALKLGEQPTRFLSTVQIGITSIGILNGIVGEAVLARPLAAWARTLGVESRASEVGATAVVVAAITYVTIVVGELVPKRLGQLDPERIACMVARPMDALSLVTRPFVHLLASSTSLLLRLLGHREHVGSRLTEADIHEMLAEGSAAGVILKGEHDMVRNLFRLDDRTLGSLVVPRADVVWLDADAPLDENLAVVARSRHMRYPVCRGDFQRLLGTISTQDLLGQALGGAPIDPTVGLRPATFVPASLSGLALLERFRATRDHMVFVLDEYGGIQGLVTLHDLVATVFGEMAPDGADGSGAVRRADGTWLLDGLTPVVELRELLGVGASEEDAERRYHTLSGLLMWRLGRLPGTGDATDWEGWRLEVVDLDGRRIDKVLATPVAPAPADAAADA